MPEDMSYHYLTDRHDVAQCLPESDILDVDAGALSA